MGHVRIASVLTLVLLGAPARAADYWVDPAARGGPCDDAASGRTVEEALCSLDACIGKGLLPGDRCVLREAFYTTMPDPGVDGLDHAPVVFARYGRERVVFVGDPAGEGLDLDLRGRADVRYDGLGFWNVRIGLEGARRVVLHDCWFDHGPAALPGWIEGESGRQATGDLTSDARPADLSTDPPAGGDGIEATPLPVVDGGTGGSTPEQARANLGAAAEASVVHNTGNEVVAGKKTFNDELVARRADGVRHSAQFASIAACLADLPPADGVCHVDSVEDDPLRFADTNPAGVGSNGTPTGRKDAVVVDARDGHMRWLSTARPPWGSSGTTASEADVPFVFQVRYHDSTDLMADNDLNGIRDGDSWSCGIDLKTCSGGSSAGRFCATNDDCAGGNCTTASTEEFRTCPTGHVTGGSSNRDRSWWYTGQCNANLDLNEQRRICGGQSIFEVRYPQMDDGDGVWEAGEHVDKPAFKVGTHGVGIYFPETDNGYTSGILTVFRSNDNPSWSLPVKNKPFFSVNRDGTYTDGGLYVGGTSTWPYPFNGAAWQHDPFIAWFNHDIGASYPAVVVESADSDAYAYEVGPVFSVYSRSGYTGDHRRNLGVNQEEALGVYANGDLVLGATCPTDSDGPQSCQGTMADSQRIIWRGEDPTDGNDLVLHATDPSAPRDLYLPDQSGFLTVSSSATTRIECGTVSLDVPALAGRGALSVAHAVPSLRARSACTCSPPGTLHADVLVKGCAAPADGTLVVSLYNLAGSALTDVDTPSGPLEFCCMAK